MTSQTHDAATDWTVQIQEVLEPHMHQIPYGNLRSEFSRWDESEGYVANLAIVYEVPGGSTNQINITYYDSSQMFSYIALDGHDEHCTSSIEDVRRMVGEMVSRIPTIRRDRLVEDLDRWAQQGLSQRDLFQKMNSLLKIEDLRGGTITMQEMKYGISHIMAHYRPSN